MPLRRAFAPMLPEFDSFLFAAVGEERDGIPLSVLSALSRLGLDPRDEAARLSHLTKEAAADQLARMIARLSDRRWPLSEARRIAGKPHRLETGAEPISGSRVSRFRVYSAVLIALLVSLIAGGFLFLGS
jgi:hypothetical protein